MGPPRLVCAASISWCLHSRCETCREASAVDRGDGDGNINELPWASVFDPAANARALSAIQAEGFRAASELVDRFVRVATSGLNTMSPASAAPQINGVRHDLFGAPDIEPLIRSWWSMVGQLLLGGAARTPASASPQPA